MKFDKLKKFNYIVPKRINIMGWGIIIPKFDFTLKHKFRLKDLYLSKISKSELEDKLEESNDMIQWYKERLIALAANTTPTIKDEHGEYEESIVDYAQREVRNLFDDLQEEIVKNFLIRESIEQYDEIISDF